MGQHELIWGLPVIGYLFMAGLGAGALVTSTSLLLRGPNNAAFYRLARYGAVISFPTVALGVALLVLELGSFQAGNWFRWINLYMTINLSPMSIGSWLLLLYFFVSAPYVLSFLLPDSALNKKLKLWQNRLAYACIVLAIGVAVYTGVLLGAMPARPLWNSPILAMLFLVSAISTGIAAVLITDWAMGLWSGNKHHEEDDHGKATYMLVATDTIFIAFELLIVFLFFMYAHLTVGNVKEAIKVFEFGGALSMLFWLGVVVLGLVIPALIELWKVVPKLLGKAQYKHSRAAVVTVSLLVIAGGFLLRYVIVVGGQISHLASI